MKKHIIMMGVMLCSALLMMRTPIAYADEIPAEYRTCIRKGLEWLAKQQFADGHWEATGGQYLTAMTALSGMSFLMEGSTLREGKYADRIRRAVDWLISQSMPNGMIGSNPQQHGHYMYGHGYSLMFLACVYGEEGDSILRRKLHDILTRAVLFTGKAQSNHGGWTYISCAESDGGCDSSSTVTQMQALRAARNAGIVVPKEIVDKGFDYLRKTTTAQGGVVYGWHARGSEARPPLTAAALASAFGAGQYESDLVKKWLQFCQKHIPLNSPERIGHGEYIHYYLSQIMYVLGEERYAQLFPGARPEERLTWSKYRKATFDRLLRSQAPDGSWSGAEIGPVYCTAMHLTILQLDNGTLPIYQR